MISRLLSHFWTANDSRETRQAQIEDWVQDLREYGARAVDAACTKWRQNNSRRPSPAEIRALCIEQMPRIKAEKQAVDDWGPEGWLADLWGEGGQLKRCDAIAAQEALYKRSAELRNVRFTSTPEEQAAYGRELCNEWAVEHGYPNWGAVLAEKGDVAHFEVARWAVAGAVKLMPLEPGEQPMSEAEKDRLRQESVDYSRTADGS